MRKSWRPVGSLFTCLKPERGIRFEFHDSCSHLPLHPPWLCYLEQSKRDHVSGPSSPFEEVLPPSIPSNERNGDMKFAISCSMCQGSEYFLIWHLPG